MMGRKNRIVLDGGSVAARLCRNRHTRSRNRTFYYGMHSSTPGNHGGHLGRLQDRLLSNETLKRVPLHIRM